MGRSSRISLYRAALLLCLGLTGQVALAAGGELPGATNLRTEAAETARKGRPLVILFSRKDCKYCEIVRRDHLKPLSINPPYRDRIIVRQINQDSAAPLIDFRGEQSSHAQFSASEKIKLVPVVAFYGPDGKRLATPIVGARIPDFYQGYLEEAIDQSIAALAGK